MPAATKAAPKKDEPKQYKVRVPKAEARIQEMIDYLKKNTESHSYDDLHKAIGIPYDVALFSLSTLHLLGRVKKANEPDGAGRPRVVWKWVK